jgi:hypothetical protein
VSSTEECYSDDETLFGSSINIGVAFLFKTPFIKAVSEDVYLRVNSEGAVQIESISQWRATMSDNGRNKRNVLQLWAKLDEYLLHPTGATVHVNGNGNFSGNQAPVQVASPHAYQTFQESADINLDQVARFLAQYDTEAHRLELDNEAYSEIQAEVDTIRAQIRSPRPKRRILAESFRTIRSVLEGTAGGLAARYLLEVVKQINLPL